jgi:CelD/BcsL family acetyltransferase involved in cellulose biosynthesis
MTGDPMTGDPMPGDGAAWTVEVRRDDGALAAIAADWDDLHRHCATATPFQSGDWLRPWWDVYGRPGTLRLVLVRRDGSLVAGAALTAHRSKGRTVLTAVGAGVSDFEDVLVRDEFAVPATDRLVTALLAERGWDLLHIRESRPDGPVRALAARWPGPSWGGASSTCLQIPVAGVPEILAAVGGSTAKTLRKKLRKIDTDGFTVTQVAPDQAEDGIRSLLALHRRQWEGRPVNLEHLSEPFARHLTRAGADLVRNGRAVLHQYRLADRLVACELVLVGHDFAGAYLFGFEPELREQIDVAAMLIRQDLIAAAELGRPTLSLLRGDEAYKMRWRPVPVQNAEWALARPGSVTGAAYTRYRRARVAAVAVAKQRLPWLIPAMLGGREKLHGLLTRNR